MLLLLFQTQDNRFALDCRRVVEVVPWLAVKKLPKSPDYVQGIVNYRGTPVPVIDLCHLLNSSSCGLSLSTRIILINYPHRDANSRTIGLLAERVTETVTTPPDWTPPLAATSWDSLYIEATVVKKSSLVRWFDPEAILPDDLATFIFREM